MLVFLKQEKGAIFFLALWKFKDLRGYCNNVYIPQNKYDPTLLACKYEYDNLEMSRIALEILFLTFGGLK